jgi:hypothetical protein
MGDAHVTVEVLKALPRNRESVAKRPADGYPFP